MQAEADAAPAARTEEAMRPAGPAGRPTTPEPTTPAALWPTFMRRTLAEEQLLRRECA
jgi:hypothetical protein